jgi:hypothetical protein
MTEQQAATLAAFARLPDEVRAALLAPFDPETIRIEDCLSDEEVERILAEAAAAAPDTTSG